MGALWSPRKALQHVQLAVFNEKDEAETVFQAADTGLSVIAKHRRIFTVGASSATSIVVKKPPPLFSRLVTTEASSCRSSAGASSGVSKNMARSAAISKSVNPVINAL